MEVHPTDRQDWLEEKYEVLQTLEDDGHQVLMKARHRELGEECLVRMRPHRLEDPDRRAFFEAHLPWFTRLKHPHVGTVFDVTLEGRLAVMEGESSAGRPFGDVVTEAGDLVGGGLGVARVIDLAIQMVQAVAYLHAAGWAHGNLSPQKFWLLPGPPECLRLLDPGLARLVGSPEQTTAGGLLMKRLRYAPPERFVGAETRPSVSGDLYVIGLMLYELATGRYPIAGDQPTSIAAGHLLRPPLDFAISDPDGRLPGDLKHALLTCLAKTPEARFADLGELERQLRDCRQALPEPESEPVTVSASPEMPAAEGSGPQRRAEVRRLLDEARQAAEGRDYTLARRWLREGQLLAPDDARLAQVLRDVERAARDQQLEQRRREELEEVAAEVERLLAAGDWKTARRRVEESGQRLGTSRRLQQLQQRVEELEKRSSAPPSSPSEADALVEKARWLSQMESFDQALSSLEEALRLSPDHAGARTLSASVEVLSSIRKHEQDRESALENTTHCIRRHLDENEPGRAMVELNQAVARYGDRSDLQELRFEIAQAFLREELGDGAGPRPPQASTPQASPSHGSAPRAATPATPASRPREAPPPVPGSPPVPGTPPAGPGTSAPDAPSTEPAPPTAEPPPAAGVGQMRLAGLAVDEPEPAAIEPPPVQAQPSPWLDLRRGQAWLLILAMMILVALLGHWLASRDATPKPPAHQQPVMEAEDVRPTTPEGDPLEEPGGR